MLHCGGILVACMVLGQERRNHSGDQSRFGSVQHFQTGIRFFLPTPLNLDKLGRDSDEKQLPIRQGVPGYSNLVT